MPAELALLCAWSKQPCVPHHLAPPRPPSLPDILSFAHRPPLTLTWLHVHLGPFLGEQASITTFQPRQQSLPRQRSILVLLPPQVLHTHRLNFQLGDLALSQGHICSGQLSWALHNLESHPLSWAALRVGVGKGSMEHYAKYLTWIISLIFFICLGHTLLLVSNLKLFPCW